MSILSMIIAANVKIDLHIYAEVQRMLLYRHIFSILHENCANDISLSSFAVPAYINQRGSRSLIVFKSFIIAQKSMHIIFKRVGVNIDTRIIDNTFYYYLYVCNCRMRLIRPIMLRCTKKNFVFQAWRI